MTNLVLYRRVERMKSYFFFEKFTSFGPVIQAILNKMSTDDLLRLSNHYKDNANKERKIEERQLILDELFSRNSKDDSSTLIAFFKNGDLELFEQSLEREHFRATLLTTMKSTSISAKLTLMILNAWSAAKGGAPIELNDIESLLLQLNHDNTRAGALNEIDRILPELGRADIQNVTRSVLTLLDSNVVPFNRYQIITTLLNQLSREDCQQFIEPILTQINRYEDGVFLSSLDHLLPFFLSALLSKLEKRDIQQFIQPMLTLLTGQFPQKDTISAIEVLLLKLDPDDIQPFIGPLAVYLKDVWYIKMQPKIVMQTKELLIKILPRMDRTDTRELVDFLLKKSYRNRSNFHLLDVAINGLALIKDTVLNQTMFEILFERLESRDEHICEQALNNLQTLIEKMGRVASQRFIELLRTTLINNQNGIVRCKAWRVLATLLPTLEYSDHLKYMTPVLNTLKDYVLYESEVAKEAQSIFFSKLVYPDTEHFISQLLEELMNNSIARLGGLRAVNAISPHLGSQDAQAFIPILLDQLNVDLLDNFNSDLININLDSLKIILPKMIKTSIPKMADIISYLLEDIKNDTFISFKYDRINILLPFMENEDIHRLTSIMMTALNNHTGKTYETFRLLEVIKAAHKQSGIPDSEKLTAFILKLLSSHDTCKCFCALYGLSILNSSNVQSFSAFKQEDIQKISDGLMRTLKALNTFDHGEIVTTLDVTAFVLPKVDKETFNAILMQLLHSYNSYTYQIELITDLLSRYIITNQVSEQFKDELQALPNDWLEVRNLKRILNHWQFVNSTILKTKFNISEDASVSTKEEAVIPTHKPPA